MSSMGLLNTVWLFHGIPGCLAGALIVATRGRFLIPRIPPAATVATDAFGCAVFSLGLAGLLLWREGNTAAKRAAAASCSVYHSLVVTGAAGRALSSPRRRPEAPTGAAETVAGAGKEEAAAALRQGWGSVAVHGAALLWFLAWIKYEPRAG